MFQLKQFPVKQKPAIGLEILPLWYVTGLCERAASFTFSRTARNFVLYFAIKLSSRDENLLYQVQDFFCSGKIYKIMETEKGPKNPKGSRKMQINSLYFRITAREGLQRTLRHFEQYPLRGEKHKRYAIWQKMVVLKNKYPRRKKLSLDDFNKLTNLARELSGPLSHNRSDA